MDEPVDPELMGADPDAPDPEGVDEFMALIHDSYLDFIPKEAGGRA